MATQKCVVIFKGKIATIGWSEVWYMAEPNLADALAVMDGYVDVRRACMTEDYYTSAVRVSSVGVRRSSRIKTYGTTKPGTITVATHVSAGPFDSLLCRKEPDIGDNWGLLYMRGIPEDLFLGTDYTAPAYFVALLITLENYVNTNQILFRTTIQPVTVPAGYAYEILAHLVAERRSSRRIGRPFGLPHGRRMIA